MLKRVIGLVREVESELVNQMRMACQVEEVTAGEGGDNRRCREN